MEIIDITNEIPKTQFSSDLLGLARSLKCNLDTGPWLAGGALTRLFMSETMLDPEIDIVYGGDIDIFFRDFEQSEACSAIMFRIDPLCLTIKGEDRGTISASMRLPKSLRNDSSVLSSKTGTVSLNRPFFYPNAISLISDFDFTVCCIVSDGVQTVAHVDAIQHIRERKLVHQNDKINTKSTRRLGKYLCRSFVPEPGMLSRIIDIKNRKLSDDLRSKDAFWY